jgi:chemotaxis signal transduction protein
MSSPLLLRLKQEFDSSFERDVMPPVDTVDIMYILVATRRFALGIKEVSGLAKLEKLVAIPSRAEAFAGVTGLRGEVLPVYDIGKMLGLDSGREPLRWMVTVSAQGQMLAVGFAAMVGYGRIAKSSIEGGSATSLVKGTVLYQGERVGLIDVQAVVGRIHTEAEN